MWFFALNYATGPGHADHVDKNGARVNPKGKPYLDPLFRQPTAVPDTLESHGGEDVGVYASGPYSHVSSNEPMMMIIIKILSFSCSPVFMSKTTCTMQWLTPHA